MDITIKEKVKLYIERSVHAEQDKIHEQTLIFKEGFMDSMAFIVLITYLEEEFRIKIKDNDLIEENFESIDSISEFVYRKLSNQKTMEIRA